MGNVDISENDDCPMNSTGLRTGRLKLITIIAVILVRYVLLPVIGIGVVKAAGSLGFLPSDPLYRYVLLIQFALPPAMNIGNPLP